MLFRPRPWRWPARKELPSWRPDAIVVGASLRVGHRLLGSLAVRLVRAGKWPVTVVP